MKRFAVLPAALVAAILFALPAAANEGVSLRGVLTNISASSIAVTNAKGIVTTCARATRSPGLDGYTTGDAVAAVCVRPHRRLVLAHIRHLQTAPVVNDESEPTNFAGAVTALSDTSISLHDGDRDLTCSIGSSSPSTQGVKVGQHVRVVCVDGVLTRLEPITPKPAPTGDAPPAPAPPPTTTTGAAGIVSLLSADSITVHTDGGEVRCLITDGSPSVAEIHVGDHVKMGCTDNVLKTIAKVV